MFSAQLANNQKFELAPLVFYFWLNWISTWETLTNLSVLPFKPGTLSTLKTTPNSLKPFWQSFLTSTLKRVSKISLKSLQPLNNFHKSRQSMPSWSWIQAAHWNEFGLPPFGYSSSCHPIRSKPWRSHQSPLLRQKASANLNNCVEFRGQVLNCIIELFMALPKLDYVFICDCLITTGQPEKWPSHLSFGLQWSWCPWSHPNCFQCPSWCHSRFPLRLSLLVFLEFLILLLPNLFVISCQGKWLVACTWNSCAAPTRLDPLILEKTKSTLNPQMSLHHQALSCANGFSQAGTTNDEFLRKNLDFLSHASNWAKFSATVSLGSIHRGQLERSRDLLSATFPDRECQAPFTLRVEPWWPLEWSTLITVMTFYPSYWNNLPRPSLKLSSTVPAWDWVSLGWHQNDAVLEVIKGILYADNAIAGESAGVSIGLWCWEVEMKACCWTQAIRPWKSTRKDYS